MALAAPTLAKYQEFTTPGATFVSPSWTPTAARLYLAWVIVTQTGSTVGTPTVTGNGLTWVQERATEAADSSTKRGTLFKVYGSGSPGAFTVSMGGTSHISCIVSIYEQSGVTSAAALIQSVTARNFNAATLTITLGAFGGSTNTAMGFFGIKAPLSGGATGVDPGSGFTELTEDDIDKARRTYVEYRLSADTTVDVTLTGSPTDYASHHIYGVAIEIAAGAVGWTAEPIELLLDVDEAELPEVEPPVEPPVVVEAGPSVADQQSPGARPHRQRESNLIRQVQRIDRDVQAVGGQMIARHGSAPVVDADPVNPPDGSQWILRSTREFCWRVDGVTQRLQPSLPPDT